MPEVWGEETMKISITKQEIEEYIKEFNYDFSYKFSPNFCIYDDILEHIMDSYNLKLEEAESILCSNGQFEMWDSVIIRAREYRDWDDEDYVFEIEI